MSYSISDLPARIAAKIAIRADGCWEWIGYIGPQGYAKVKIGGRWWGAHRFVYTLAVGPIPAERPQLDHLCCDRTQCAGGVACPHRRCVNPSHLEPVTQAENLRRATRVLDRCYDGHLFDEANTRFAADDGRRICRKCVANRARERRARSVTPV